MANMVFVVGAVHKNIIDKSKNIVRVSEDDVHQSAERCRSSHEAHTCYSVLKLANTWYGESRELPVCRVQRQLPEPVSKVKAGEDF